MALGGFFTRAARAAPRGRLTRLAVAVASVLAMGASQPAGDEGATSVWSGVYTQTQAQRGAEAYAQSCQACHGAQLNGVGEAKPLAGPEFLASWNGLTVGDLFERMRTTMPMSAPRSLAREAYADILAYLLKFNGFPAGSSELAARGEALAAIRIDAWRPSAERAPRLILASFEQPSASMAPPADGPGDPAPDLPNPYVADPAFLKPPAGRTMGSTSAVAVDSRGHIWVADRCGANDCADSDLDPIMEFDAQGRFIKAFGRGMVLFAHGVFIDAHDHIWVTDGHAAAGMGADVLEFDTSGQLLRTLGKPGVSRAGEDAFSQPNAVLVAPNGDIFVADGHEAERGVARIVKFAPDGRYLKQWGAPGSAPGEMNVPHTLAMDSRGRLFVGDRWNNRVDIYDQDGRLLDAWTQFGRPSGVYIDRHDVLYVTDSESRAPAGYGHHPGWRRGVRIGSARTGKVTAFIPDAYPTPDKSATSGAEGVWADPHGVVYGAQVLQKAVVRYTPAR
jgi:mono/diheme cytochrome c family protein/sugar lactone lactonase YvrE